MSNIGLEFTLKYLSCKC